MQTIAWPFLATEALAAEALTFRELRRFYAALYPGVWAPRGIDISAVDRARAAWLWSGRRGVLAGLSASALLGAKWIGPESPAELIHSNRRVPPMLTVHSDTLAPGEMHTIAGMIATTPARTAFDLGRILGLEHGLSRVDALMNATDLKAVEVEAVMANHRGVRGLVQLRSTLDLADGGAESPYETTTRLLLIQKGFPRPQTQIPVYDERGRLFARIDMGWPEYRVGVDFEGKHHWIEPRQRDWDVERYAKLPELGWLDTRVTARMLHNRREEFFDRVGAALIARGCPRTW
jgi:hypothetical protein